MIADFHTHSLFSGDSSENPVKMIETAINLGMEHFCFTDHQDFDYNYDEPDFMLDHDKYFAEISELKERYKDKITISVGVETGLEPHLSDKLREFVKKHPYDFIIGSTHLVNGVDPWYPEYFEENGEQKGFLMYFEYILKSLETCSDFDVYGHLDYIARYAPNRDKNFSYAKFADVIDEILKRLVSTGKGIELNTGGLHKEMSHTNPHPDIVRRYRELGGEVITVGSDGHTADKLGYGFDVAREILINAGFSYYAVFCGRKPQFIKL